MPKNARTLQVATLGFAVLASAMLLAPAPRTLSLQDRAAERAWSARLDRSLSPIMADCVRFEISGHVAPMQLESIITRASGDPRLLPHLGQLLDAAMARCTRRHGAP